MKIFTKSRRIKEAGVSSHDSLDWCHHFFLYLGYFKTGCNIWSCQKFFLFIHSLSTCLLWILTTIFYRKTWNTFDFRYLEDWFFILISPDSAAANFQHFVVVLTDELIIITQGENYISISHSTCDQLLWGLFVCLPGKVINLTHDNSRFSPGINNKASVVILHHRSTVFMGKQHLFLNLTTTACDHTARCLSSVSMTIIKAAQQHEQDGK